MPVEQRTSQSTNSLSLRSNEFLNDESDLPGEDSWEFVTHSEDEDDIFDDDKIPEEKAAAHLRASKRRGYDSNSSIDENDSNFLSGAESFVSSTPSIKRSVKKKKVQSDFPDFRNIDDQLATMCTNSVGCAPKGPTHRYTNPHLRRHS